MSTVAEVQDVDKLEQAIADLRSDVNGVERKAWLLVGHMDNNPNMIDIVDSDNTTGANILDFTGRLEDDQAMYGLLRLTSTVDMSTTVKFVYVHWMGENIPFVKKGRYGVVHGSVQERFNPYHQILDTSQKEELEEANLVKLLDESSGRVNRIVASDEAMKRPERGFLAGETRRQNEKSAQPYKQPVTATLPTSEDFMEALSELRDDSSARTWLLAGYEDGKPKNPLTIVAHGEGGIDELREKLDPDQVLYGLYRITDVIDDIKTVKFVYICWIGDSVKPMVKAKASAQKGAVEMMFSPVHVLITTSDDQELTEKEVLDKVSAGSGSKSFVR